ncbi:MAG: hypothetical protein OXI96_09185 [Acidimicrobiaceae bacterium]|nr:hypothetical protein [Acidimicrobiaceae bacterium]
MTGLSNRWAERVSATISQSLFSDSNDSGWSSSKPASTATQLISAIGSTMLFRAR